MLGGVQADSQPQHSTQPPPRRNWLQCCGDGGQGARVQFFCYFVYALEAGLGCWGMVGRRGTGGRGCLPEAVPHLPHWLSPCTQGKIKHQLAPAGAWTNEARRAASRCVQLFSPLSIQDPQASCSVGPRLLRRFMTEEATWPTRLPLMPMTPVVHGGDPSTQSVPFHPAFYWHAIH